ncbi:hypothetical protein ACIBCB_36720 [Streptomyces uncialis]|uniref:hypothetical protein n=1 Tax=Streptomyces uncialis TaxID=1048205 RepID=UPI003794BC8E
MRDWRFTLHLQDSLTPRQLDTLFGLESFSDGRTNLVRGPDTAEFWCTFKAETLTDAIAEALGLFEDLPGVLVRSVELDEIALDDNGMWTPAVVPAPPPVEAAP